MCSTCSSTTSSSRSIQGCHGPRTFLDCSRKLQDNCARFPITVATIKERDCFMLQIFFMKQVCFQAARWKDAFPRHYSHVRPPDLTRVVEGHRASHKFLPVFPAIAFRTPATPSAPLRLQCRSSDLQAFLSALTPGSHIVKHFGPSNRMLRVWLGPESESREPS